MEAESISLIDRLNDINDLIGDKVIGSRRIVRFMFISLLTGNHILLEGVPGLAKTMLADEFSKHLGVEFKRIQFTPDMLPSDITGNMVYNLELKKWNSGRVLCLRILYLQMKLTEHLQRSISPSGGNGGKACVSLWCNIPPAEAIFCYSHTKSCGAGGHIPPCRGFNG